MIGDVLGESACARCGEHIERVHVVCGLLVVWVRLRSRSA